MFCGLAQSLPQIVLARLLQGLCGAALVPLSQAVLLDINPPERHARAMAVWVMGVTLGPIIGPALGGWLTENYNWRWVFYINVPFGILAFLGILSFLPETAIRKSRFDFFGFSALSVAIGAFQIMLDRGQLKDWFSSTEIWIEATVAAVAFYLFIMHMLTTTGQRFVSPGTLQGPKLPHRQCVHFHRRGRSICHAGAVAAVAAGSAQLPCRDDRPGDRTARGRYPGGDVHRRTYHGQDRHPPDHRRRLCVDRRCPRGK